MVSSQRYLFVRVDQNMFGLPVDQVKEIVEFSGTTKIPMCNEIVHGVINVRGAVIPILDLKQRLFIAKEQQYDHTSCVVLYDLVDINTGDIVPIGLVVHGVLSIVTVTAEHAAEPPSFGAHIPKHFIDKMVKHNQTVVPLLNMDTVLDIEEINQMLVATQAQYFSQFFGIN